MIAQTFALVGVDIIDTCYIVHTHSLTHTHAHTHTHTHTHTQVWALCPAHIHAAHLEDINEGSNNVRRHHPANFPQSQLAVCIAAPGEQGVMHCDCCAVRIPS